MRERYIGNGLDLLHSIDCRLDFQPGSLLAIVSPGALFFRTFALDEVADLLADNIHDCQQRLIGSLLIATEEFHHPGNLLVDHDGQTKCRTQDGLRREWRARKV